MIPWNFWTLSSPLNAFFETAFFMLHLGFALLTQVACILAFSNRLYQGAYDEAAVCLGMVVLHRVTIGRKYASLTPNERRRLYSEKDRDVAAEFMRVTSLVRGWLFLPNPTMVITELELAAAFLGVNLHDSWLVLLKPRGGGAGQGGDPMAEAQEAARQAALLAKFLEPAIATGIAPIFYTQPMAAGDVPPPSFAEASAASAVAPEALKWSTTEHRHHGGAPPVHPDVVEMGDLESASDDYRRRSSAKGTAAAAVPGATYRVGPTMLSVQTRSAEDVTDAERDAAAKVAAGYTVVNSGLVAMALLLRAQRCSFKLQPRVMPALMLVSLFQALLPLLVRSRAGEALVGDGSALNVGFFAILAMMRFVSYAIISCFMAAGVLDYVQRSRVLAELGELISGEYFDADHAAAYTEQLSEASAAEAKQRGAAAAAEARLAHVAEDLFTSLRGPGAGRGPQQQQGHHHGRDGVSVIGNRGGLGHHPEESVMGFGRQGRSGPAERGAGLDSAPYLLGELESEAGGVARLRFRRMPMLLRNRFELPAQESEVPRIELSNTRSCYAWLSIRIVLLGYGVRMRNRAQEYITITVLVSLGFLVWQVVIAVTTRRTENSLGEQSWAFWEACILFLPCAFATMGVELFGARANDHHRQQRVTLLKQRALLLQSMQAIKEHSLELELAVKTLTVAAEVVAETEPLMAFGFPASHEVLKAVASALVRPALAVAVTSSEPFHGGIELRIFRHLLDWTGVCSRRAHHSHLKDR